MAKYRYVGGAEAEIWDTPYKFTKFGQLVEMDDEMVGVALAGHIHIIPAEEWDKLGFTDKETKSFTRFESHNQAPQEFIDKRNTAWVKAQSLHAPKVEEAGPSPVSSLETDKA